MSANTLTARSSVRSPRRSLTTPATYPKYTKPPAFPANFNRPPPISRPLTEQFRKKVVNYGLARAGAQVGARFVPYAGWGLLAYDVYNYVSSQTSYETQQNPLPQYVTSASWVGGNRWRYYHSLKSTDFASNGWQGTVGLPLRLASSQVPNNAYFDVYPSDPNRHYFYSNAVHYSGSYYYWYRPAGDPWVTGNSYADGPMGSTTVEVTTEVIIPRPWSSPPTPFPSSPNFKPEYKPAGQPAAKPARSPQYAKPPQINPALRPENAAAIEMILTPDGVVRVRPTGGRGGRKKGERKSKAKAAGIVLSNLYGSLTEFKDFWEILKENFDVPDGLNIFEEFKFMQENFENVDWVQLAIDLGINHIEDAVVGKIHGSMKPGFSNLDFGTLAKFNLAH